MLANKTNWPHILKTVPLLVGSIIVVLVSAGLHETERVIRTTGIDIVLDASQLNLGQDRFVEVTIRESSQADEAPLACLLPRRPSHAQLAPGACAAESTVAGRLVRSNRAASSDDYVVRTYTFPIEQTTAPSNQKGSEVTPLHIGRIVAPELPNRAGQYRAFHLLGLDINGQPSLDVSALEVGAYTSFRPVGSAVLLEFAEPFAQVTETGSLASKVSHVLAGWDNRFSNAIIGLLIAFMIASPFALAVAVRHLELDAFVPRAWRKTQSKTHPLAQLEAKMKDASVSEESLTTLYQIPDSMSGGDGKANDDGPYLAYVMQAATHQWDATGRTPLENFESILDEVASRHDNEPGLAVLDHIASASPVLGFLGTALGMAKAFEYMDGARVGLNSEFSTAMQVALATTILGLLSRVVAQLCLRAFDTQMDRRLTLMRQNIVRWATLFDRAIAQRQRVVNDGTSPRLQEAS